MKAKGDEDMDKKRATAEDVLTAIREMLFLDDKGACDPDKEQDPEMWDDITNEVKAYFSIGENDVDSRTDVDRAPVDAVVVRQLVRAAVRAFAELNAIRSRDGVPYTHEGWKSGVDEDYFSSVVDGLDDAVKSATGKSAHCHPELYA